MSDKDSDGFEWPDDRQVRDRKQLKKATEKAHWDMMNNPKQYNKRHAGSGCFIATACYGDYNSKEVLILREFRDEILSKSRIGKNFIMLYYKYSPKYANLLENTINAKVFVRKVILNPIVWFIKSFGI